MTDRTDELAEARAAIERVRELADHWEKPKVILSGHSIPIRPEYAAKVLRRALDGGDPR